jgi:energy-coupling factor transporter ATP-binding protein EcfA2
MSRLKNWISYYKNSLSDSENLAIDISRIQNLFYENNFDLETASLLPKNATSLIEIEEKRINKFKGISKKDSPKWHVIDEIEIVIAPFQLDYSYSTENFQQKTIHPFWIAAKINKEGELFPPKEHFPLIVRNYLSPVTDQGNGFIFASMNDVEEAKGLEFPSSNSPENPISWAEYIQYINSVFLNITQNNLDNYRVENYTTSQKTLYFATSSKIATAKSILFLYQNLVQETENLPLLTKIANPSNRVRKEAITNQDFLNYNHLHLGQMSDDFPLSISQRKSLLSHLTAEENSVTAVNGPPGTGKTTLLQSLVATEVVKAAVKGEEAPLILACSTNNQAVTNIIDSFVNAESTFSLLADRWIPNFNGYATYLPSNSKNPKNLENINFLKGNLFGHEGTLCELENEEYLLEAERYFLNHFNEYSENKTEDLEEACDQLRDEIIHLKNQLEEGVTISKDYLKSIKNVNGILLQKEDYMTTSSIAF